MCLTLKSSWTCLDVREQIEKLNNKIKDTPSSIIKAYKLFGMEYVYTKNGSLTKIKFVSPFRHRYVSPTVFLNNIKINSRYRTAELLSFSQTDDRPKHITPEEQLLGEINIGLHSMYDKDTYNIFRGYIKYAMPIPHIWVPVTINANDIIAVGTFNRDVGIMSVKYNILPYRLNYKNLISMKSYDLMDAETGKILLEGKYYVAKS